MRKKKPDEPPRFRVSLDPRLHKARRQLPGNVRQRIKRLIDALGYEPRPAGSRELRLPDSAPSRIRQNWEVRRLQMEDWRVVYAVSETWEEIAVLRIAKRPPYRYDDLEFLLGRLAEVQ